MLQAYEDSLSHLMSPGAFPQRLLKHTRDLLVRHGTLHVAELVRDVVCRIQQERPLDKMSVRGLDNARRAQEKVEQGMRPLPCLKTEVPLRCALNNWATGIVFQTVMRCGGALHDARRSPL